MKKVLSCLVVSGFLVAAIPLTASAFSRGLIALWSGTFSQNAPAIGGGTCSGACVGDLVTCTLTQGINITKIKFSYLEGVCDDLSSTAAEHCNGKFTQLEEECGTASPPNVISSGDVSVSHVVGLTRTCYDAAGVGDCTGSPPAGQVIYQGSTRTQTRSVAGLSRRDISGETNRTAGSVSRFTFNGRGRRLRFGRTMLTIGTAADASCGFPPTLPACGIAGSSFKSR